MYKIELHKSFISIENLPEVIDILKFTAEQISKQISENQYHIELEKFSKALTITSNVFA